MSLISPSESKLGLVRRLGIVSVIAFGVTNEVGNGLFFISTQIQETAPGVGNLVPWLMVIGALVTLLVAVIYRFFFASGLIGAGGEYVMISRVIGKPSAFIATFLAWFGFSGAMSISAYVAPRFMADVCVSLGAMSAAHYLSSTEGTLIIGLCILWGVWFIHVRGIRVAGTFVIVAMIIVIAVTLVIIVYGFSTPPDIFKAALVQETKIPINRILNASPTNQVNTYEAFFIALPILYFSYLGLSTATQTGDEARNAKSSLSKAVFIIPVIVGALYTLFTFAVYHTVPWQLVAGLNALHMPTYTTSTGLFGLIMPRWLSIVINAGVAFIIIKALLPIYLAQSRWMYAWSQDGLIPKVFSQVHKKYHTPVFALTISAVLGSLGLIESINVGYVFGVSMRVLAVMIVFIFLGISVILFPKTAPKIYQDNTSWMANKRSLQLLVALLVIVLSAWFGISILYSSIHEPVILQPGIQLLAVALVAVVILLRKVYWHRDDR